MSYQLLGNSIYEEANKRSIQVYANCESHRNEGIQYIDILLNGARQGLGNSKHFHKLLWKDF